MKTKIHFNHISLNYS